MRIAIHSASSVVTSTLAGMLADAGHTVTDAASAELLLCDLIHPAPMPAVAPPRRLELVRGPTPHADQIACPVRADALLAQLVAMAAPAHIALHHGWVLDPLSRSLSHPPESVAPTPLTEKETALLAHLADGEPRTREALLAEIWGISSDIDTHTLETHIYRLRHKLAALTPPPCDIITQEGSYRLVEQPA